MTEREQAAGGSAPGGGAAGNMPGSGVAGQHWLGALLGEVISQTDNLFAAEAAEDDAHPVALREVAERHRGEELSVDPVMVELVEAVISDLASRISHNELRRRLVFHVAESLSEDPAAYKRVSSLWRNLQRSLQ